MMSLLNVVALVTLASILVQDGLANPSPPFVNSEYSSRISWPNMDQFVYPGRPRYRPRPRPRTDFRNFDPDSTRSRPDSTLPPDLLDVPLQPQNQTTPNPDEAGHTSSTGKPSEDDDGLPVDDPIEPEPDSLSPRQATPPLHPDLPYDHPDTPRRVYPSMYREPEAKFKENSDNRYRDPVLRNKLKYARGELGKHLSVYAPKRDPDFDYD